MAAIAHLGVGLAAKRVAPKAPVWALVVAAWAIDLVFGVFVMLGMEQLPGPGVAGSPYSHGLLMAVVWSVLGGLVWLLATKDRRTALLVGGVVFSHWIVDFISKPMFAAFPSDTGLPLLFDTAHTYGLGLYRTALGQNIGEYGTLVVGAVICWLTVRKLRAERKAAAGQKAAVSS
jgi:hypothetical protein